MESSGEIQRAALAALREARGAGGPGRPLLSLVAPVRDEEASVEGLVTRALHALSFLPCHEIVLVDDGSADGSLGTMRRLARRHPEVSVLAMGAARGQSAALWRGIQAARAEVIATIDADLQQDPADLPGMIARLPGVDAVVGYRATRQDSLGRRAASRVANRVRDAVLGARTARDSGCSLRVMRTRAARSVVPFDGMHRFLPSLLIQGGHRLVEVPVSHAERRHGRSKYGLVQRGLRGAVDVLAVRWLGARRLDGPPRPDVHLGSGSGSGSDS